MRIYRNINMCETIDGTLAKIGLVKCKIYLKYSCTSLTLINGPFIWNEVNKGRIKNEPNHLQEKFCFEKKITTFTQKLSFLMNSPSNALKKVTTIITITNNSRTSRGDSGSSSNNNKYTDWEINCGCAA